MQNLFTRFSTRLTRSTALLVLLLLPLLGWGQSTIATQDFETSPATPTAGITPTGGTYYTGSSGLSDKPTSSPFYSQGARAYGVSNGTSIITSSANIDASSYSNISLQFRLASFSINSAANGADAGDLVTLAISTDGGNNYNDQIRIAGNSNARWSYTTGTGTASRAYSTAAFSAFAPATGGDKTTDGYSTISVTDIPTTAQLRFRITLLNNDNNERWIVDNLLVQGTAANSINTPTFATTPICASTAALLDVTFTATGTFTATNTFTVQLSNASGSFASPVSIATLPYNNLTTAQTVTASIPANTPSGTGYLIRVVADDPATTSTGPSSALTIVSNPTVTIAPTPTATTPQNTAVSFTGTETPAASSREWFYGTTSGGPYGTATGVTATTYSFPATAQGTFYVVLRSTFAACGTVTSAETAVTVNPPSPVLTVGGTLAPFNTLAGVPSAAQTLTVSGLNLLTGISITPPTGYAVSIDGGTTYATGTQTVGTLGTLLGTTVLVRLTGLTATASLGTNLQIRSTGATNQDRTVSGTVVAEPTTAPTVVAGTPGTTTVTLTVSGGNGSNYLVVVRPAGSTAVAPTDQTTYTGTAAYGTGATTGTMNYVVLAGSTLPYNLCSYLICRHLPDEPV